MGPAGGYIISSRDGVSLRIRHVQVDKHLKTEYRISARWQLPDPTFKLLAQLKQQVLPYTKEHQSAAIPFEESARMQLLDKPSRRGCTQRGKEHRGGSAWRSGGPDCAARCTITARRGDPCHTH